MWRISCDEKFFDVTLIDKHSVKKYRERSRMLPSLDASSPKLVKPSPYTCASLCRSSTGSKEFEIINS